MKSRFAAIAALIAVPAMVASAQRVQPELRADVLGPRPYGVHGGAGMNVFLGTYTRVGALAGYGARPAGGRTREEWRGDLVVRLTLDPFRQQRWGLSLGGGVSVRRTAFLLAVADVEGPAIRGWLPALQFGAGGGLRAGLGLRRAINGRR